MQSSRHRRRRVNARSLRFTAAVRHMVCMSHFKHSKTRDRTRSLSMPDSADSLSLGTRFALPLSPIFSDNDRGSNYAKWYLKCRATRGEQRTRLSRKPHVLFPHWVRVHAFKRGWWGCAMGKKRIAHAKYPPGMTGSSATYSVYKYLFAARKIGGHVANYEKVSNKYLGTV